MIAKALVECAVFTARTGSKIHFGLAGHQFKIYYRNNFHFCGFYRRVNTYESLTNHYENTPIQIY